MFELIVRVVLASATMAAAGILGRPDFDLAWKSSLLFAAYSYLLYLMEQKGARNPGASGLAAVADCGIVSVLIADFGALHQFGFLSALPMLYAFWRHRSNAAMMSPLVASWLLVGANLFGGGNAFTPQLLVQALGVLLVGVVLSQVRAAREAKREAQPAVPTESPLQSLLEQRVERHSTETVELDAKEYGDFRESYRQLADSARELEKRSRKDRACVQLFESAARQPRAPFAAIASRIHDLCGAEGVLLYSVSNGADALIVRSSAGNVDSGLLENSIELPKRATDEEATRTVLEAIAASRDTSTRGKFATALLKARNKIVGVVAVFHSNSIELEASMRRVNESADFVAELVIDQAAREDDRRKVREAELLYSVATTATGATTLNSLVARVVRDLNAALRLDHVSVWTADQELVAVDGTEHRFIDEIAFDSGKGLEGWLRSGAPLTAIANARTDSRTPSREAVSRRIGAVLIVPLEFGPKPFGLLMATTSKPNGIDTGETETLRAVCAELSQWIARLEHGSRGPEGLATPKEFFEIVQNGGEGFLAYLEVPNKSELEETYGAPAIEHAIRKFSVRLRSELPKGATVTRRNEGDYVVFVPAQEEEFVRKWANEAAALASLIGVTTPDGRSKIPLALKSKVAPVNARTTTTPPGQHLNQIYLRVAE